MSRDWSVSMVKNEDVWSWFSQPEQRKFLDSLARDSERAYREMSVSVCASEDRFWFGERCVGEHCRVSVKRRCWDEGRGVDVVSIHTHPSGSLGFSKVDMENFLDGGPRATCVGVRETSFDAVRRNWFGREYECRPIRSRFKCLFKPDSVSTEEYEGSWHELYDEWRGGGYTDQEGRWHDNPPELRDRVLAGLSERGLLI